MLNTLYTILNLAITALTIIFIFFMFKIRGNLLKFDKYRIFTIIISIVLCILSIIKIILGIILQIWGFSIVLAVINAILLGFYAIYELRSKKTNDVNIIFNSDENKKDYIDVSEEDIYEHPEEY